MGRPRLSESAASSSVWSVLRPPKRWEFEAYPLARLGDRWIRVALDREGARHLLIPSASDTFELPEDGFAIGFTHRQMSFGDDSGLVFDIMCHDHTVNDEFDALIEEIMSSVGSAESAVDDALGEVRRWRRFLAVGRASAPSLSEQMGLFAELEVLRQALAIDSSVLDAWRGPYREPHDFEFSRSCLEVKAVGPDTPSVEVHGLSQFDRHDRRDLELLLLRVGQSPDGVSAYELAHEIEHRYGLDLSKQMHAYGVPDAYERGEAPKFHTLSVHPIVADESMPRLGVKGRSGAEAFSRVHYNVTVAALVLSADARSLETVLRGALLG